MKKILTLLALIASTSFAGNPVATAPQNTQIQPNTLIRQFEIGADPVFTQDQFRAVIIGDSQTTSSWSVRITAHYHRWDGPFVGEFLGTSNSSSGNSINNISRPTLDYRWIDPDDNWTDGGPGDHFSRNSAEWEVISDVPSDGAVVGRYRVNLSSTNTGAPWSYNWVENEDLVFRVAVRSGPNSVPAIEIRPDRETLGSGTVFEIPTERGIQIFEIPIPASMNPDALVIGGAILFPEGYVEESGQLLQILGAYVGLAGDPDGLVIGYQGDSGWNLLRHQTALSQDSRLALIEMLDLDTVMMVMGHNREWDNQPIFPVRALELINTWNQAFQTTGRRTPRWVLVEPWRIQEGNWDAYGEIVREGMSNISRIRRGTKHVRFGDVYNNLRPDEFDPTRYTLDSGLVHPGTGVTAKNMMFDLEFLIFED